MASAKLHLVGPFPPPRHGVSSVNEAVAAWGRSAGLDVSFSNTAPNALGTSLATRLSRWRRVMAARRDVRGIGEGTLYMSVSGGWGMLYELMILGARRSDRVGVVLHHHSFRYLDAPFEPMRRLARAAGPDALHMVLCPGMGRALQAVYPRVRRTLVLSNAAFMSPGPAQARRKGCRVVGHLSNLSREKGVFEVLEAAAAAREYCPAVRFQIAGPFESDAVEAEFRRRVDLLPNVSYVGALYGPAKSDYFQRLDCFLFPTRYRNEAEPLVIHEALGAGCPVVAFDRGCIGGMVDKRCGRLIAREGDFQQGVRETLAAWLAAPAMHQAASEAALARFQALRADGLAAKERLLANLKSEPAFP